MNDNLRSLALSRAAATRPRRTPESWVNFRRFAAGFLVPVERFNLHFRIQRGRNHGKSYPDHQISILRHF